MALSFRLQGPELFREGSCSLRRLRLLPSDIIARDALRP